MQINQSRQALTVVKNNFSHGNFRSIATNFRDSPRQNHASHENGSFPIKKEAIGKWALPAGSQQNSNDRLRTRSPSRRVQPSLWDNSEAGPSRVPYSRVRLDRQENKKTNKSEQQFGLRHPSDIRKSFNFVKESQKRVVDVASEQNVAPISGEEAKETDQSDSSDEYPIDLEEPKVQAKGRTRHLKLKDTFKRRGSLISSLQSGMDIEIPGKVKSINVNTKRLKRKNNEYTEQAKVHEVLIPRFISVINLAQLLKVRIDSLQICMRKAGMDEESSYDHVLPYDYASLLAEEFGKRAVLLNDDVFDINAPPPHPDPASLPHRPPVVTIMGHVDHGKTTILDNLRSSSVAKNEAGGITQHIGAFSVPVPQTTGSPDEVRSITFLDTPGHAAFSSMRSRGAQVTDIIVLVVAADDGVMPQTKEVIDLIKKEGDNVGVVVAINKVDKHGININKIQTELMAEGLELEIMGGDIPSVEVSGLTGQGLDKLVETISVLAELRDLRAEREGPAFGYVLEAEKRKGIGLTATVLLLRGSLTPASHIISGLCHAKVRQLTDSSGQAIKVAYPGMAVTVSGWKELPNAGEMVIQASESDIKKALQTRFRKAQLETTSHDVDALNQQRLLHREKREAEQDTATNTAPEPTSKSTNEMDQINPGPKELKLIVKGDVIGSVEALSSALQVIGNKDVRTNVVFTGVGLISESDISSAKAINGMVVALSTGISREAKALAAQMDIPVFTSSIIYDVIDEVKSRVVDLLPTIKEQRVTGEATVLQLFQIQGKAKKIIKVAGCRVTNGILEKSRRARLVRDHETIHEGNINTLRFLKKDVMEIKKGFECGLSLVNFDDIREGDLIQMYQEIEKPGQL